MRPAWLIEAGVYGAEAGPLLAEIRRQGMVAEAVPFPVLQKEKALTVGGRPLADNDCAIGYGTFPFARQIQLHRRWVPGAWCDPANLDCAAYFARFGRFLLNQPYALLPGVEAVRQRDWLYGVFGRGDEVFARPAGCHKPFTGRCVYRDDFAALGQARRRAGPTGAGWILIESRHRSWRTGLYWPCTGWRPVVLRFSAILCYCSQPLPTPPGRRNMPYSSGFRAFWRRKP
jgi:hypothetical protein